MISRRPRAQKGVALIIVLLLVVLTTIMVVAFLASVKTETSATRAVVGVQNSRQLADLAVQTVISQIQQATQTSSTRPVGTVSWASQPGMIRCYDNTGAEIEWYKLYSAQNMAVTNFTPSLALIQSDLPETSGTSGNWATSGSANYGVFTDLNSPVTAADGTTLEYPIMNPAAATSIASAAGATTNAVLGFDIQNPPGYSSSSTSSATNNQAAMPVRWLYVLQNGTMVPGVASGTPGTVTVTGASTSNPIVGRVAFWTDDETCKLNVNTAADGTYYDTPRFASSQWKSSLSGESSPSQDSDMVIDRQMAISPPIANEFQRYVGQPAQTRLSYVLGSTISNSGIVNKSHLLTLLSPFMQWGGSAGGVYDTFSSTTNPLATPTRQTPYASLDEWMFGTQLNSSLARVVSPGDPVTTSTPLLTNTRLQQLRFFLTASSDAPEVNLFGQPRISMWPIYTANLQSNAFASCNYTTTFDQLIANASTLTGTTSASRAPGGSATTPYTYYFGRNNAASPTADWGTSALSFTSSTTNTRNQNIFAFLHTLANHAVPGYGESFAAKYSTGEMDQILTEIFDYCRSLDPSDLLATSHYASTGVGTTGTWGDGQVTPIYIAQTNFGQQYSTQGFGRFYSINEVTFDLTQSEQTDTVNPTDNIYTGLIYLSLNCPAMGYPSLDPHMRIVVQSPGKTGIINMSITTNDGKNYPLFGTPANGANGTRTVFSVIPAQGVGDSNNGGWNNSVNGALLWGGPSGTRQLLLDKNSSYSGSPATAQSSNYMLCGVSVEIPKTCTSFSIAATPLEILIYHTSVAWNDSGGNGEGHPSPAGDTVVQDITVQFPAFSALPLPVNMTKGENSPSNLNSRLGYSPGYGPGDSGNNGNPYIQTGDVVESLVAGCNGDSRIIAAQHTINDVANTSTFGPVTTSPPSPAFVPHPLYGLSNQPSTGLAMAHSHWDIFPSGTGRDKLPGYSNPSTTSTGTTGQLVPNATYTGINTPATGFIDSTLAGKLGAPDYTGDWDNGWGHFSDGAYINKADEVGYQYYTTGGYFGGLTSTGGNPLYYDGGIAGSGSGFSSPNRTVASPVMFGSLPTGVPLGKYGGSATAPTYTPYATVQAPYGEAVPWQTLLFRPQAGHYGGSNWSTATPTIEDEALLDWFWMPVVEPYAISSTFDTTGKVNMNYQIAPFTYIIRATALMGVLGSEYVIAAPTTAGSTYKTDNASTYPTYRTPVKVLEADNYTLADTDGTFRPFKDRFATGEIFRSATEICDIYLVPEGQSWTNWDPAGKPTYPVTSDAEKFWATNQLTGDNTRERPYNGLYSRLTTKSNTYTVHVRAQSLKSPSNLPAGEWIENPQLVASEYRGSVTVNRYLDPQDTNIPDFMSTGTNYSGTSSTGSIKYSLDNYYKYRVLETRQFLP